MMHSHAERGNDPHFRLLEYGFDLQPQYQRVIDALTGKRPRLDDVLHIRAQRQPRRGLVAITEFDQLLGIVQVGVCLLYTSPSPRDRG